VSSQITGGDLLRAARDHHYSIYGLHAVRGSGSRREPRGLVCEVYPASFRWRVLFGVVFGLLLLVSCVLNKNRHVHVVALSLCIVSATVYLYL